MSEIKKLGKIEHEIMEPRWLGGPNVTYELVNVTSWAYLCLGCSQAWAIKWHARECEKRGHVRQWEQRYGGYTENGIHKGYKAYQRYALQVHRKK